MECFDPVCCFGMYLMHFHALPWSWSACLEHVSVLPQNRVAVLTKIVERRIQPYVDGDKEGFRKEIHREADRLAKTPFGVPLMHIIAYVPFPCPKYAMSQ